jgi:hypothetical protein
MGPHGSQVAKVPGIRAVKEVDGYELRDSILSLFESHVHLRDAP